MREARLNRAIRLLHSWLQRGPRSDSVSRLTADQDPFTPTQRRSSSGAIKYPGFACLFSEITNCTQCAAERWCSFIPNSKFYGAGAGGVYLGNVPANSCLT
jgi:hypothetical protein